VGALTTYGCAPAARSRASSNNPGPSAANSPAVTRYLGTGSVQHVEVPHHVAIGLFIVLDDCSVARPTTQDEATRRQASRSALVRAMSAAEVALMLTMPPATAKRVVVESRGSKRFASPGSKLPEDHRAPWSRSSRSAAATVEPSMCRRQGAIHQTPTLPRSTASVTSPELLGHRLKATKAIEKGTAAMLHPFEVDRPDPVPATGLS